MPGPVFTVADVLAIVRGVELRAEMVGKLVPFAIEVEPRLDLISSATLETDVARMRAKMRIERAKSELLAALTELEEIGR